MKIIQAGTPKPKYPWLGKQWEAQTVTNCGTIIELEEVDEPGVKYVSDQRDGEWVSFVCPVCDIEHNFYPLKDPTSHPYGGYTDGLGPG